MIGKTIVYRPGGFSRGTSHFYNVWREVSIVRGVFEDKGKGYLEANLEYVTVPSLPPEEVFLEEKREQKKTKIKKDMDKFVKMVMSSKVDSSEVFEVLDSLVLDSYLKEYMDNILVSYGFMRGGNEGREFRGRGDPRF